jgi:hypothetical protein
LKHAARLEVDDEQNTFDFTGIFDMTKINKQIAKIPPTEKKAISVLTEWKEKVQSDFAKLNALEPLVTVRKIAALAGKIEHNPKKWKSSQAKIIKLHQRIRKQYKTFHDAWVLLQDLYMLGRILKQGQPNVMVYVGDAHARKMRFMLQQIGFTTSFSQLRGKDNKQCVLLKSEPLFTV